MSYGNELQETQGSLKSFVTSKIFNQADAADIIQNVNRIALKKAATFNSEKNFEAWLIGIAKFQIKDYFKKRKKSPDILSLDIEVGEEFVAKKHLSGWLEEIPFSDLVKEERNQLALQIRSHLTKKQALVFDSLCEGLTSQEMAQKLDMSTHAIYILRYRMILRAKAFLKRLSTLNDYDYQNKRYK